MPSLYIGNVEKAVYDSELFNFFKRNGFEPKNVKVILDKDTKAHKGFAYACFYK